MTIALLCLELGVKLVHIRFGACAVEHGVSFVSW